MKRSYPVARRVAALLTAGFAALLVAGCYTTEQTVRLHGDGRAEIAMVITLPPEMNDILAALQSRMALSPATVMLRNGICAAANDLPIPIEGVRIAAQEFSDATKYECRISIAINDFPRLLEEGGAFAAMAGLTPQGPRTYRYQAQTAPLAMFENLWALNVRTQLAAMGAHASDAQVDEIVARDKTALRALMVMMFRESRSTFTISAPEIVETNGVRGAQNGSEQTATFTTTIKEAVALMFEPDGATAPFVVFRY